MVPLWIRHCHICTEDHLKLRLHYLWMLFRPILKIRIVPNKIILCRPWLYRNLEQTHSMMFRVLSYTLPSLALSLLLNIPKFLEARIEYKVIKSFKVIQKMTRVTHKRWDLYRNLHRLFPLKLSATVNRFSSSSNH